MKRSQHIKLTLMMGGTIGLAGCGDSEESALLFQDVDQCTSTGFDELECRFHYQEALERHEDEAPKYATQQLCESDFGYQRCENEGSIWRPLMAGFMVGLVAEAVAEAIDETFDAMKKKRKRKSSILGGNIYSGAAPLYRSRNDYFNYRNSQNAFVATTSASGNTLIKTKDIKYTPKPKKVNRSRGGFGRSASRSSWGG